MSQATNSNVAFWGCIVCVFVAPELWMKILFAVVAGLNILIDLIVRMEERR